jgi:hypothetical protein
MLRSVGSLFVLVLVPGCYDVEWPEGILCGSGGSCPDGLECGYDNRCRRDGPPDAAGSGGDSRQPSDSGPGPIGCPEPIHTEFTINGMPAVGGGPIATVLIGDTVHLDATGSCSQGGEVRYRREFSGGKLLESAEPGNRSQMLAVFRPARARASSTSPT